MLDEITIANVGSYAQEGQALADCKKVNFIFGTNGSGKTTISRVIADPDTYPDCRLTWRNGRALQTVVYNSDFAARNFRSELAGIFTLGKATVEILNRIEELKEQRSRLQADVINRKAVLHGSATVSGKMTEIQQLRSDFENVTWALKTRHDDYFKDAFEGVRNSRTRFCDRLLTEHASNTAAVVALDELKLRAGTIFTSGLQSVDLLTIPDCQGLADVEKNELLTKRIVGKDAVDIAGLIKHLGNSDWVRQGKAYLLRSKRQCPFCQQELLTDLEASLNDYFDEAYIADLEGLNRLRTTYNSLVELTISYLQTIVDSGNPFADLDGLRVALEKLKTQAAVNLSHLDKKVREPSLAVSLDHIAEVAEKIQALILSANQQISGHNDLVANRGRERNRLISEIWRCLLQEIKVEVATYNREKQTLERAIEGLTQSIREKEQSIAQVTAQIEELERTVTSVQPTVNAINGILASFGFTGFRLETVGQGQTSYRIVRPNGSGVAP